MISGLWAVVQAFIAAVWAWFAANEWVLFVAPAVYAVFIIAEAVRQPTVDEEDDSDAH